MQQRRRDALRCSVSCYGLGMPLGADQTLEITANPFRAAQLGGILQDLNLHVTNRSGESRGGGAPED